MAAPGNLTFTELLALKSIGPNHYEALHNPRRLGNAANIVYGGFQMAVAAQAASASVPPGFHMYTLMGNFLGPALIDRKLIAKTRMIRKTRTFVTYQVEVLQRTKDGKERACLVALADFQVKEKGSLLEYNTPPLRSYTHHSFLREPKAAIAQMVKDGNITKDEEEKYWSYFQLSDELFEFRGCPEAVLTQNLYGIAKKVITTQEHVPITEKSTADWIHCRTPLTSTNDNMTALTWFMDSAISFAPLSFSHRFFEDAAATGSLDFALRIFRADVDLTQWHLREISTVVGGEGRTYSEARIWNEAGQMVASCTEQSILRKLPEGKGVEKLSKI